jgi:flagellar hook-associated protein 2
MMQKSVYNSTAVSVTGKNADAVTIKTSMDAVTGTLTIGKIESLAKGASASSAGGVSESGSGFLLSAKLGDITFRSGEKLQFDIDGKTTISINDKSIELSENDTITSMINKINNSGANVTMSYDRLSDKFTLESKNIGGTLTSDLQRLDDGNFFNLLGLDDSSGSIRSDGAKARVQINGEWVTSDTNTFDFRGIKITLNRTTNGTVNNIGDPDEDIKVTLKRDTTEAVDRIKSFVDAYNSIIKRIEGLVKERKNITEAAYEPLTKEEKSLMSEKQIEEWEAIAKKGILRNDNGLQSIASSLRNALYENVKSAGLSPSAIGLTTGNFFSGTGGQIVIDENKLRAALEEDPDRVAEVFAGTDENKGLLWRMNSIMGDYLNRSQPVTLKNLEDSIRRANEQMTKMQEKMYAAEDKLYKQFAAMETALSKLQSQGDWMNAMLGIGK